jgi:hypothetical protein
MVKKLGPPAETGTKTYQNGFGAKFDYPWARWSGPLSAYLERDHKSQFGAEVVVQDSEWAKQQAEKRKNRPNSLD